MNLNPNLRMTVDKPQRIITQRESFIIEHVRQITPKAFLKNCSEGFSTDIRLLGMFSLALMDYNNAPPRAAYTVATFPEQIIGDLLIYGTEFYILQFMMMKYSLIDISYSDGGLSIQLDRTSKIGAVYDKFEVNWLRILGNAKNNVLLAQGGVEIGR